MINYDELNKVIVDLDTYVKGLKNITETQSILGKSSEELFAVKAELDTLINEIKRFADLTTQTEQMRTEVLQNGLNIIKNKIAEIEEHFSDIKLVEYKLFDINKQLNETYKLLDGKIFDINKQINETYKLLDGKIFNINKQINETEKKADKRHKSLLYSIIGIGAAILIAIIIGFFL